MTSPLQGVVTPTQFESYKADNATVLLDITTKKISLSTWNVEKGLRRWKSALAKAPYSDRTNHPCCVILGDSVTASTGATDYNNGFPQIYRNAIQLATNLAGRGFRGYDLFVSASGWTNIPNKGTNLYLWVGSPTASTITFSDSFNSFDVIYTRKPTGGNGQLKVDGMSIFTLDCYAETEQYSVKKSKDYGLTTGKHTIEIIPPTSGDIYIEGLIFYNNYPGLLVHQLGHPGIRANDYRTNEQSRISSIGAFSPALTVIMLGTNDFGGDISIANYKESLTLLTQKGLETGDVLLVTMGMPRYDTHVIKYQEYADAAKEVASENDCAYLSIYDRWNKSWVWADAEGLMFDDVHPSQYGHYDIAEALREVLGGIHPKGVLQTLINSAYGYGNIAISAVNPVSLNTGGSGLNVAITEGVTNKVITLTQLHPDSNYRVNVTPNWNTTYWVTGKNYAQFTINFGTIAPVGALVDWEVKRY